MKKTTLFEETSYWCSINMAEGLVKQRFEKTEGKSRKSLSFSLLKKIKTPKSLILTSKEVKENAFANETNELGPAWYKIKKTSNSRTRRKSLSYSDPETKIKDLKALLSHKKELYASKEVKETALQSCIRGQIMPTRNSKTSGNEQARHDLSVLNKRLKSHLLTQNIEPSRA